jgi:midasin
MNHGPLTLSSQVQHASPERASEHLSLLLVAYHRILSSSPHLADERKWPISSLASLFSPPSPHPERGIRLVAILCFAIQSRMSEANKFKLIENCICPYGRDDAPLPWGCDLAGNLDWVDGWAFAFQDMQDMREERRRKIELAEIYDPNPAVGCSSDALR